MDDNLVFPIMFRFIQRLIRLLEELLEGGPAFPAPIPHADGNGHTRLRVFRNQPEKLFR